MAADTAADRSRQCVIAGLIDRLLSPVDAAYFHRRLFLVSVPACDVAHVGPLIAAEREWPHFVIADTASPPQSLLAIAREINADPTGTQSHVIRQIIDAADQAERPIVAVLAGTRGLRAVLPALPVLAAHQRLVLIGITDAGTAGRVTTGIHRIDGIAFRLVNPADRSHAARRLMRIAW